MITVQLNSLIIQYDFKTKVEYFHRINYYYEVSQEKSMSDNE